MNGGLIPPYDTDLFTDDASPIRASAIGPSGNSVPSSGSGSMASTRSHATRTCGLSR